MSPLIGKQPTYVTQVAVCPTRVEVRGGIISQIHHDVVKDTDTEWNPPISFTLGGVKVGGVDVPGWGVRASYNRSIPSLSGNTTDREVTNRAVALGSWTDFVIQLRYDPWNGYMKTWIRDANSGGRFVLHSHFGKGSPVSGWANDGVGYAKTTFKPYWKIGPYFSFWSKANNYIMVDTNNVEVRRIDLHYDSIRYFVGNLATDELGIEYVKPR